ATASRSKGLFKAGEGKGFDAETGQELFTRKGPADGVESVGFSAGGRRGGAAGGKGGGAASGAPDGRARVPRRAPARPKREQDVSPDGGRLVRVLNGQAVVQPRALPQDTGAPGEWRRLDDPAREHFWRLRLVREAQQGHDAFALAFHLKPLLLTA